jgi:pyruvate,water dikinase
MTTLTPGLLVTVSCCEGEGGKVYEGEVPFTSYSVGNLTQLRDKLPSADFVRINIGEPSQAIAVASKYPDTPVGLVRMEFVISQEIRIHPMALVALSAAQEEEEVSDFVCACCASAAADTKAALREIASRLPVTDSAYIRETCAGCKCPGEWFIQTLAQNLATIASAFYPKPVLIRTSDFKTNEYEALIGAALFESHEENPLLGFRGVARYTDLRYEAAFRLEVKAIDYLRRELGLHNVEVLVPFVRSPDEGARVLAILRDEGALTDADSHPLKVNLMCELPTNALLLEDYLQHGFDAVSIGSNDLAMLTCGIDRDSADLAARYGGVVDEATYCLMCLALDKGQHVGKCVGVCGEAGTDPDLLRRLLAHGGLGYVSVNPSSLVPVMREIGAILEASPSIRQHNEHHALPTLRRGHPDEALKGSTTSPTRRSEEASNTLPE